MIAYAISYWLQREPIYEALAHQDGIHLPTMGNRHVTGGGVDGFPCIPRPSAHTRY